MCLCLARARVSFIYFWVPHTRPRAGCAGNKRCRTGRLGGVSRNPCAKTSKMRGICLGLGGFGTEGPPEASVLSEPPRRVPLNRATCGGRGGARREGAEVFSSYALSMQQSRPTRGRPGYMESYPNPSATNGKPSRRPAVTAHMPHVHVPPEPPNLHSRSATASEQLGFMLVTDGLRIPYVPPTGGRCSLGCPPIQQKLLKTSGAYRASVAYLALAL